MEPWKDNDEYRLALSNLHGCAYNAAVNYGSGRAHKKMVRLIEAINHFERLEGQLKLQALVDAGVIEGFKPCPPECEMRPGGLFHAKDCENDFNHPVTRDRRQRAREVMPGGRDGNAGFYAASVSLVG